MSAEILREAASLMRERAAICDQAPWIENGRNGIHTPIGRCVATTHSHDDGRRKAEAQHIASWHPSVALAVANWLDATAVRVEAGRDPKAGGRRNHGWRGSREALAVARAYLGGDA